MTIKKRLQEHLSNNDVITSHKLMGTYSDGSKVYNVKYLHTWEAGEDPWNEAMSENIYLEK